jgi:hypothetical protein
MIGRLAECILLPSVVAVVICLAPYFAVECTLVL